MPAAQRRSATLTRNKTGPDGTWGVIRLDSGWECFTGELPWKDNEPNASCIPPGEYRCAWDYSPERNAYVYRLVDVPGRSAIEIHAGNIPQKDSKGCILVGIGIGPMNGKQAVLFSRDALTKLETELRCQPFLLTIKNGPEGVT